MKRWEAYAIERLDVKNMTRNWIKIHGADLIKLVRESGVPIDGMIMKDFTFVPKWAADAIDTFKKNGGYADMELSEFLKKVNPG